MAELDSHAEGVDPLYPQVRGSDKTASLSFNLRPEGPAMVAPRTENSNTRPVYDRGIDGLGEWAPAYEHAPLDSSVTMQPALPHQADRLAAAAMANGDATSQPLVHNTADEVASEESMTITSSSTTESGTYAQRVAVVKEYVDHEIRAGRGWLLNRDYLDESLKRMIREITRGDFVDYAEDIETRQDSSGEVDGPLAPKLEDIQRIANGTLDPEAKRNFETLERAALELPSVRMAVEESGQVTKTTWSLRTDTADQARAFQAHTLWVPSDIISDGQLVRGPYPYASDQRQYYPHYLIGARLLEHDSNMTAFMVLPAAEGNPGGRPGYTSVTQGRPRTLVTRTDIAKALAERLASDYDRDYSGAELTALQEGKYLKITADSPRSYYVTRQIHKGPSGLNERCVGVSPWRFYNTSFDRGVPAEYMSSFEVSDYLSRLLGRLGTR